MTDINEITLEGEIAYDPEVRYSQAGNAWAQLVIKTAGSKGKGSFHRCKCFGEVAELLKDFAKGERINVRGHMQSGQYEKDGKKVYTYEPVLHEINEVKAAA